MAYGPLGMNPVIKQLRQHTKRMSRTATGLSGQAMAIRSMNFTIKWGRKVVRGGYMMNLAN